ncbi:MAG: universal stress protein [Bryobacteraceae bacterium]
MPTIKKILFPVDFSQSCEGAARYVEAIAGRFQAEITLLHLADTAYAGAAQLPGGIVNLWQSPVADAVRQNIQFAQGRMKTFLVKDFEQFDVKREVMEGDPSSQIVAASRASDADLIMVPTHGLGTFRRFVLGSTAAKVLHDVECPVWTSVHLEMLRVWKIFISREFCALSIWALKVNPRYCGLQSLQANSQPS